MPDQDYIDDDQDRPEDNQPELIKQTEDLYFALEHNVTREARNVIRTIFNLVKEAYETSNSKEKWNQLLVNLQGAINNFENELADSAEMTVYALEQEALKLSGKVPKKSRETQENKID